jgi:hypothetical protein
MYESSARTSERLTETRKSGVVTIYTICYSTSLWISSGFNNNRHQSNDDNESEARLTYYFEKAMLFKALQIYSVCLHSKENPQTEVK